MTSQYKVLLGQHETLDEAADEIILDEVTDSLESTQGRTLLIIEDISFSDEKSTRFSGYLQEQYLPSQAYLMVQFPEAFVKVLLEYNKGLSALGDSYLSDVHYNLLLRLDTLYSEFCDSNGVSKFVIEFEGDNDFKFDSEEWIAINNTTLELYAQGKFIDALNLFLRNCQWMAEYANHREANLIDRIMSNQAIDSVIVRFGTNHRKIHHELYRRTRNSRCVFLNSGKRNNVFDPQSNLIMKIQTLGVQSVSELDLHLAFIGTHMLAILSSINRTEELGMTFEEMIFTVVSAINWFKQPGNLEVFQRRVLETDFVTALMRND